MPVAGLVTDRRVWGDMPTHQVNDEYITAIRDGAGVLPLLIPSTDTPLAIPEILKAVDGLLFTGAPSNVAPSHYGGTPRPGTELDPPRDAITLPLLRAAIEAGVPVLAICRGFQELNVALGGSLHQHVHEIPGRLDHREPQAAASRDVEYAPAHTVQFAADGVLARLTGVAGAMVNSLHHQGIDRLAPGLKAEATAPDGLIEAVSMPGASGLVLGVQWHPEWRWAEDRVNRALFAAFGQAIRTAR